MKKFLLAACLILTVLAAAADAQLFTSETTHKAGEKLRNGDRAGAIAVLDQAIEKRKDLLEAHQMRANLRLMGGDIDGAISDYTVALGITPDDARLYERRAGLRELRRDYAGAVEDLSAAITHGAKSERVYEARARIKRDTGDADGAIADYQAALAVNPNLAAAANGLASLLERQKNDPDAALAFLQGFIDRYESKTGGKLPALKGGTPTGDEVTVKPDEKGKEGTQATTSLVAVMTDDSPGSEAEMERRRARMEQLGNLAIAYANLGRMYAKKNDPDRAAKNYEKGLKINENSAYLRGLRSELRLKRGDLQGAIEDLQVAAANPTGPFDRHFNQGMLLLLQGKDAEADKEFAQHLQMFPESKKYLTERIEETKKLRAQQPQD